MDFMTLFGAVIAVLFHPGSTFKINGQKICRRGTERPCYKVSYIQDGGRRLTFEEARQACRVDGGELLSIETEGEQRLIERFIQQLQAGDGDFWIGLRRSPQHHRATTTSTGCPSQYYWLDGSKAKFRNWHWDEPSCGGEMCAVLYHQPSAPPDEEGHFLFQWNDDNCSSKNNFVCKYPKEMPAFTAILVPTVEVNIVSTTETNKKIKAGLPESSVSFSDSPLPVSYILYATIPAVLLLLIAVAGFFCYRQHSRRKPVTGSYPSTSKQWMSTAASPAPSNGPYAFSDVTKLTHTAVDTCVPAHLMTKYPCAPAQDSQCGDYENVSCADRESGFVTNDIYETCRAQSLQVGWVENEIYG
ncbi:layilin isoform X2 [Gouania willdenowi]|uniref:layilin isoform X2 n=1 Tax=Gouania willdenowi TaxID=441366 RepID=UPI00105538D7|nr:layilin-like isoform X2 [Gouania willdenowi]